MLDAGVCAIRPVVVVWINMRRDGRMHHVDVWNIVNGR